MENTFRGHPCWRIHPTGTLEGELSICHAYSGCQVLIDLCTDYRVISITYCHSDNCLFPLSRCSNGSIYRESEGGSHHDVFTVEVETWNHWF